MRYLTISLKIDDYDVIVSDGYSKDGLIDVYNVLHELQENNIISTFSFELVGKVK